MSETLPIKTPKTWAEKVQHYVKVRDECGFPIPRADLEDWEDADRFTYRVKSDFAFFFQAIMVDRGLYTKARIGPVDLDIADFMANGRRELPIEQRRRRCLLAFRGEGKTHKIAALTCFRLLRDTSREVFIVSKSEREVKKTVRMIRKWIGAVWFLKHLEPTTDNRDAGTFFDVRGSSVGSERQPSVSCIGITGQLEGNRGHTVIYDDGETKGNTKTQDSRDVLRKLFAEATNICYPYLPEKDGGPIDPTEIIMVGTPKHEESIYIDLLGQGYDTRSYPIVLPQPEEKVINLAPILQARLDSGERPGSPTMPLRFDEYEVGLRRALGHTEFQMEFMLVADLGDTNRHPLRLADLIVYPVNRDVAPIRIAWGRHDHNGSTIIDGSELKCYGLPGDGLYRPIFVEKDAWQPYTGVKAGIDPAGRGTDKTGLAIAGHLTGTFWVPVVKGLPGGFEPEKLEYIATILREWNVRDLYCESNIDAFGVYEAVMSMAIRRFTVKTGEDSRFPNGWTCRIEKVRAVGQKEVRIIECLEPIISTHRMVVAPDVLEEDGNDKLDNNLQYQISRITKDRGCLREDGKADALSIVMRAWQDALRLDPHKSGDAREKRTLLDQLREVADFFGQSKKKSPVVSRPLGFKTDR